MKARNTLQGQKRWRGRRGACELAARMNVSRARKHANG